jgi:biopolymer transport protein ExbD
MNEFSAHYVEPEEEDPLSFGRPVEDAEMDITPMIDIVFLLLIFFIVAGQLNQPSHLDLPPARHGIGVGVKNAAIITVGLGSGADALIYLGDGKRDDTLIHSTNPDEQQEAILDYLQVEFENANKEHVLIKAEKGVRHGEVARVSKAIASLGNPASQQLYYAVLEDE